MTKIDFGAMMAASVKTSSSGFKGTGATPVLDERVLSLVRTWGLAPNPGSYELAYLYLDEANQSLRADIGQGA